MYSLKNLISKYSFATKKARNFCKERKRIYPYITEIYGQNLNNIAQLLPKADLNFISIVAGNYALTNFRNPEFDKLIIESIKDKIQDLTPETACSLAHTLKDIVSIPDLDIYHHIYSYVDKNYFLFSRRQVENMEGAFFFVSQNATFKFNPAFGKTLSMQKNDFKVKPEIAADLIAELYNFQIPKDELNVTIFPDDRIINIYFKKLQKHLRIVGVYHHDYESILTAREIMDKKKYDFFFLEQAPITHQNLTVDQNQEEKIIEKFLDRDFMKELGASAQRSLFLTLFDRYDKLPIIDSGTFEWYVKNVLKNPEKFIIKDAEQVVYLNAGGLEKPDELSSIIYQLYASKTEGAKVVLADISPYDELNLIAQQQSMPETRELFKYARYFWFNEQVRWAIEVNRKGCPMCSKSNRDTPMDLINLVSHKRYNFAIREAIIAKQIIEGMSLYDNHKNYLGFFGEGHIYEILRYICNYIKQGKLNLPNAMTDEDRFKVLLRQKDLESNNFKNDQKAKEDFTNRFAMLAALFYSNEGEIQIPTGSPIDLQLYKTLKNEYTKFMEIDSFVVNKQSEWKKYKQEERCFGVYTLFHDEKDRFFF